MSSPQLRLWRQNGAAIIVDDAGRVLLGGNPESSAYWHLPQGGVKSGESAIEALHREIREEVGLSDCRILAEYAGLRYKYRHKNKKSKQWLGQQQTYYLLHCPGNRPVADCSGSVEFAATRWVPAAELQAELFVPFKREVVMRALEHFFPGGSGFAAEQCTALSYRYKAGSAPPTGTPLFAGGKAEAAYHLSTLTPLSIGKKQRLLIVLLGMEGSGVKKSLRHMAPLLDPLTTCCTADSRRYAGLPAALLPLPGELSLLAMPTDAHEAELLPEWLVQQQAAGIRTLTIGLHISQAKQASRLADKGKSPAVPWAEAWQKLSSLLDAAPSPSYLIPSDCAWYRDYLLSLLLREAVSQRS